jgi:hypothetical protein
MLSGALHTLLLNSLTSRRKYENVINWFEIPVADMDRAVAFYEPVMQVSLRRETMDCAELAVFPHQDPAPAARWPNLRVSRPRRRALLFICILTSGRHARSRCLGGWGLCFRPADAAE